MSAEHAFEPQAVPLEHLLRRLAASLDGLGRQEAHERLEHEGRNVLPEHVRSSRLVRLARHSTHRFALLLWAGAALALVGEAFGKGHGMGLIAAALGAVVVINALFGFWQEERVEHAMAAFRAMLSTRARVLRAGLEAEIDAADLVAGDVILLAEGDRVPADARLFEVHALKVDNSPLTGESEPQLRTVAPSVASRLESRNLVFSGTLVSAGSGRGVVYATGAATELGRIAGVTHATERVEAPIERELRYFVRLITIVALGLGVVFFSAGWAIGNGFWESLIFSIGIIVANVPEGLLPTVTLALAIAARRMAKRNALVKTLQSAETLGSTSVICTDKTGTLTRNEMRVTEVFLGASDEPAGDAPELDAALGVMTLCNNAAARDVGGLVRFAGDPTETALLEFADDRRPGFVEKTRALYPRVHERPFDSATREMATVHRTTGGLQATLKGAPEVVVAHCRSVVVAGRSEELTARTAMKILSLATRAARHGKRVLCLAQKPVAPDADLETATSERDYTFVGLVAMRDPPRSEVAEAVAKCRTAGIRIIVVSGDHPVTVAAIAREIGITDGTPALEYTGEELGSLGKAALRRALAAETVLFSRTSPLDKLRIVTALQEMGHVVAVTGDGVNDAPALRRADVGVAMGKTGTDVAREAADIVLMDDNFATIVAAVEEGRVIYGNMRRFVGYVLTSNVPEILPYIAFVLLGIPLPLPVLLILAIDVGTDMLPAIGLATEPAETNVMHEPPRPRSERLVSRGLVLQSYLFWGPFEAAAGFSAYAWVLGTGGFRLGDELAPTDPLYAQAIAAFFAAIVVCQVANVLAWRTTQQSLFKRGLGTNLAVLLGIACELALTALVLESGAGHAIFGTASPPLAALLVPIPFAVAMLAVSEVIKALRRGAHTRASVPRGRAGARLA
ncbi:MAG TPA: cation-transporting P-type ATPase [Polyangiaceae bacterium]